MDGKLQFRRVTGEQVEIEAQLDDAEFRTGEYLIARKVRLDDGTELRQHRPASGSQRADGYDRLDNEILAGRRLCEKSDWTGYPPELACLYGDEATSADPYTLFETYAGQPLREVSGQIIGEELDAFQVGLLTGLCWLAAAGIAHRAISPDTVLWDGNRQRVQITDFSRSTVFGVPRTPVTGSPRWVPKEQRSSTAYGMVGPRDDVWAAARLIFFVHQGEDLVSRDQFADSGLDRLFNGMLGKVFGPPEGRPSAGELLEDGLNRRDRVPRVTDGSALLIARRERFLEARRRKHPGVSPPPSFDEDINWAGDPVGTRAPAPGNDGLLAATSPTPAEATPAQAIGRADDRTGETTRPRQFPWKW
jgi:hypothetical protein